ncbi:MAG: c-type cytochrome [Bdellovibrionaceae bacterium]|nr:c-type cytochrome [Pseudobdellovibrionaceae bacterium]
MALKLTTTARKVSLGLLALVCGLSLESSAHAALSSNPSVTDGQFIAKCLGCHGRAGVSGYSDFPNLAGLNQPYLLRQLKNFRGGDRSDYTMNAMPYMVAGLTDDELYGLAEVFSRFPVEVVRKSEMSAQDGRLFEIGKSLITGNTTTCRFCHLANRAGDGPAMVDYPSLTGQQKNYLVNQIKAFRDKKRWNPIMNSDIIGNLSEDEIEAIAVYFRYLKAK